MGKHFQLLDFLRRAPKHLLQTYCIRRGILGEFDWGCGNRVEDERTAQALQDTGAETSDRVVADFHHIWDLAGQGFTRGIMNEAQFNNDDAAHQTLSGLTHLGKVLWAVLERRDWVANAKILSDVDRLPEGAWIKRGDLPARTGPVDPSTEKRLQEALIQFFSSKQHRGRHCKIDCLQRGDEEIFFTYAEDHPDSDDIWQNGQLLTQQLSRSFRLIFKHHNSRRLLSIYIEDDRSVAPDLQQIFARAVIGAEISREASGKGGLYDLDRLREPGFVFQHSADLGIADARVTKMRFTLDGEPWRRFMAEADNFKQRDALDQFVADLTVRLPKSRLVLDQVCITVLFHKREGDRKAPRRSFYITSPNILRLKMDALGEQIVRMLVESRIEFASQDDVP